MINTYFVGSTSQTILSFILFSIAALLLIDKIIHYIFNNSKNLKRLYNPHDQYTFELSIIFIIILFILSYIFKP